MSAPSLAPPQPSGWQKRKKKREQINRVMELYADGLSVADIAAELELTQNRVAALLGQGMAAQPEADIENLRGAVDLRLDRAAREFGKLLQDKDPKVRQAAAQGLRQVEADRARLFGLGMRPPRDDG